MSIGSIAKLRIPSVESRRDERKLARGEVIVEDEREPLVTQDARGAL